MNYIMEIKGNGSIEQLDKKVSRYKCKHWRLWVCTEDGRRSKTFTGSISEAKKAMDRFVSDLSSEAPRTGSFGEYADAWQKYREESGDYSPNTMRKCGNHIKRVKPFIGDMGLRDIRPSDIRDMMSGIRSQGSLSGTYMRSIRLTVHSIFAQAVGDGLIPSNPVDKVPQPKLDTKEVEPMNAEELSALLDKLDEMKIDGHVMAMYLMILLGLRSQEALALQWKYVEDDRIYVRNALKAADGSVADTKSAAGTRTLPMPKRLAEKMKEWRKVSREEYYFDSEYVCCNRESNVMHMENLRRWAKVHGLPTRFHQLRHSNLTIIARKMPSVFDLMRYAGWSDMKCAKIYVHEDLSAIEGAVAQMDL